MAAEKAASQLSSNSWLYFYHPGNKDTGLWTSPSVYLSDIMRSLLSVQNTRVTLIFYGEIDGSGGV